MSRGDLKIVLTLRGFSSHYSAFLPLVPMRAVNINALRENECGSNNGSIGLG